MYKKRDDVIRSRNWNVVLYPEDPTHVQALEDIKKSFNYAYILHDKDVYDKDCEESYLDGDDNEVVNNYKAGELKKPHWHVTFTTISNNARTNYSIAKQLNLRVSILEHCRNLDGSLLYLSHLTDPEKYQYNPEDIVFGGLKGQYDDALAKYESSSLSQTEILASIREYIDNEVSAYTSDLELVEWISLHGYTSVFRTFQYNINRYFERVKSSHYKEVHLIKLCEALRKDEILHFQMSYVSVDEDFESYDVTAYNPFVQMNLSDYM